MNPAHLQLVDGEVPADGPQTMAEALHHIRLLEGENQRLDDECEGLTRKLRAASGQITRLTNELHDKRKKETEAGQIEQVLCYWRDRCKPRAHVVAGDPRWEKVRARMHDRISGRGPWTVDELKLAVDGALLCPWLNGTHPKTDGKKYLDATTVFRDAKQVQRLMGLALDEQDRLFEERLADFNAKHPSLVAEAIEAERHCEALRELAPESWDMWAERGSRERQDAA